MIAIDQTGAGEPLVLLHGVGASRVVWRHVTPALAADRLVLAPDLPGFGESSPTGPGFDLERAALAIAGPLAERAGSPFDLVGNSLGGAVALELAVSRPEQVRRLVLSAPAGFTHPRALVAFAAGRLLGPLTTLRRGLGAPLTGSAAIRRVLLYGAIADPARLPADDARMMLEASRGSTRLGAAAETVLESDLRPELERLQAPLGVIWGTHDRVVAFQTGSSRWRLSARSDPRPAPDRSRAFATASRWPRSARSHRPAGPARARLHARRGDPDLQGDHRSRRRPLLLQPAARRDHRRVAAARA